MNEFVSGGQVLLTLVTHKNLRITAYIDPKFLDKIYKGREVLVEFPNGNTEKGYITRESGYAEITPLNEINPLATRQNKLVVTIKTVNPIPQQYQIHGIPVKIRFKSWYGY
ncbi:MULTISPECIES: HlyD family efflux transporter periplasmic adaptor subunit [Legionella]|uniref:HlyD family efflux transporter periplasmic adaptor subunit n=1 Tax=Legionella TaxID=445 RepID=UPI000E1C23D1|nr:HlyD family efflux transporter periplasmic adaptor subunit [Legionella maceachernii]